MCPSLVNMRSEVFINRINEPTAMTKTEWEAIAEDSAKKAPDAREILRLKKKQEDALRARANAIAGPSGTNTNHVLSGPR